MSDLVLIRLPWPPRKSSPNGSQGDFRGKASAGAKYKMECARLCMAALLRPMEARAVSVTLYIHPPDNRRRDLDNVLAAAKRGLDAVSEAIGVDDSRWQELHLYRAPVVKGGCILVDVRKVE